jgi:hypothetical protein
MVIIFIMLTKPSARAANPMEVSDNEGEEGADAPVD